MRLSRLELHGFKSFARKTVFDFPHSSSNDRSSQSGTRGDIVGIVGPNGSGKSNIADAVRWVLGEQSMKSLRGKRSEDVIFNGSEACRRSQAATVSLVFDNSGHELPIEYNEVIVTRKQFRSGESEYLINGSRVRLMDIQELLAHGRISQRSYCIVTQGLADSMLQADPVLRKEMIEDAVGIKPYQIKKHHAERKLNTALGNIERARDRAQELEPRLRSLKRQAKRMEQRRVLEVELRTMQEQWHRASWNRFLRERSSLEARVRDCRGRLAIQRQAVNEREERIRALRAKSRDEHDRRRSVEGGLEALQGEWNTLQQELIAIRTDIQTALRGEEQGDTNRHADLPLRIQEIDFALEDVREKERAASARLRECEGDRTTLVFDIDTRKKELDGYRTRQRELEAQAREQGWDRTAVQTGIEKLICFQDDLLAAFVEARTVGEFRALADRLEHVRHDLAELLLTCRSSRDVVYSTDAWKDIQRHVDALLRILEDLSVKRTRLEVLTAQYGESRRLYRTQIEQFQLKKDGFERQLRDLQSKGGQDAVLGTLRAREHERSDALEQLRAKKIAILAERDAFEEENRRMRSDIEHLEDELVLNQRSLKDVEREEYEHGVAKATLEANMENAEKEIVSECGQTFMNSLNGGGFSEENEPSSTLRAEIAALKRQLGEMGGIDPLVLEEYEELRGRFEFLTSQIRDLETTIEQLRTIVIELDSKMEVMFEEAFTTIQKDYHHFFTILFGGGKAKLELVRIPRSRSDEDEREDERDGEEGRETPREDVGIAVTAVPPGKTIHHLSQLSGGERSIVSIALLFALMNNTPPPFSVLDEIDAALDEANTSRFGTLLVELAQKTQFIVITHKRETMRQADALFGVTMGKDGVSSLLSVDLSAV